VADGHVRRDERALPVARRSMFALLQLVFLVGAYVTGYEYYVWGYDTVRYLTGAFLCGYILAMNLRVVELGNAVKHHEKVCMFYKNKLETLGSSTKEQGHTKFESLCNRFGVDPLALENAAHEYENYTPDQRRALEQLKSHWAKVNPRELDTDSKKELSRTENDVTFYRFLKARKYDVHAALNMYIEYRKFRRKELVGQYLDHAAGPNGVDALKTASEFGYEACKCCRVEAHPSLRLVQKDTEHEAVFRAFCSGINRGYSRSGWPIYLERTGLCGATYAKMMEVINGNDVIRRHIRQQEMAHARCEEISQVFGRRIGKQFIIFDMAGMSFWPNPKALEVFRRVMHIDANYYPETLGIHFIINAPAVFTGIWSMVSAWIDPVTKSKFRILGTNYKEALLLHVHPSQLPVEYGGSCHEFVVPKHDCRMESGEAYANGLWQHVQEDATTASIPFSPTPEKPAETTMRRRKLPSPIGLYRKLRNSGRKSSGGESLTDAENGGSSQN
jgi:hypothetical protein